MMNSSSNVLMRVRSIYLASLKSVNASRNLPFSTTAHTSATASLFDDLVRKRSFTRSFDKDKPVNQELLKKLLQLSQMAPSSFNLQPYKIILVQDAVVKEALADTMLGGNGQRVRDAPVTLVFLSDREPVKLLNDLIALETSAGTDIGYLRDLSTKIKFLLGNGGWASSKIRILATHLASAVSPSPVISSDSTAWSVKNTIFAAQTFILAAAAHGLGTAPMEGFDERRLCYALNIPLKRYTVPMVICTGYTATPDKTSENENENELQLQVEGGAEKVIEKEKIRYPLKDICYADKLNIPWDPSQTK